MANSRIQRYILREITTPTLLSLLIFTFVLLMGRIPRLTELVINKGVPAAEILKLFSYLLPTFLIITIPLSFLLGILLAFGRFSADSEFIALKASGVSLYSLVKPALFLAVLLTVLTGWLTTWIEPASKATFRSELFKIASSSASVSIKPGVFNDEFPGIVLYARGMNERLGIMKNVFISDEREGKTPATIIAREGRFISDPDKLSLTLRLSDGTIHRRPPKEKHATYQIISFTTYDINLDVGNQLSGNQRRRSRGEYSWAELNQAIKTATKDRYKFYFLTEKYYRIVVAFAPLVLVLVGVPLGLQSQRSGKGAGFAQALMVFLVYYILLSIAGTLSDKGLAPASVILWLPNLSFFLGGIYFLHCTAIEQPPRVLSLLWKIFSQKNLKRRRSGNRK